VTPGAAATQPRGNGPTRCSNAVIALCVSALVGAALCAATSAPSTWTQADRLRSGSESSWAALADALPVGEVAQRTEILACLLVVATSMAAAWAGHALFRGPARSLAAITGGALTAVALLHWLHATDFAEALTALPSALFATLGVTELVRSLVHLGRVTPRAVARALAAASAVALFDPLWGFALLALVGVVAWLRAATGSARRWTTAVVVALTPGLLAGIGLHLAVPGSMAAVSWPPGSGIHLGLPRLELLEQHLPATALYPALALLVLLVMPLRWRGGPALVIFATAALVVHEGDRPLAPVPALLVLSCVATAGWVWLAGTVWPRHPRLDAVQATSAAVVIGIVAVGPVREIGQPASIAVERPSMGLARLHDCALEHPGAVFLVHDPWLHRLLRERRLMEGWRPDIELTDAMAIDDTDLLTATTTWHTQGRRVMSDSFDAAGRWPAQWVAEHGPLFAFVGPEVGAGEDLGSDHAGRAWARLRSEREGRSRLEQGYLVRLAIERARFRRATGDPHAALEALELPPARQRALETRLQLAISVRPHPGVGSELPAGLVDRVWRSAWPEPRAQQASTHAALTAEAGDLLYAYGERERAVELLAEAAAEGYLPAWGALARWQLRAGEEAAHATLHAMASDPRLRRELFEAIEWLLARDRVIDARAILTAAPAPSRLEIDELATHLMVLRTLARVSTSTPTFAERTNEMGTSKRR
jgi:hypothetical protein